MTIVRILADDLTGALDAAAPFAMALGPLPVVWQSDDALRTEGSFALDSESRERPIQALHATLQALAQAEVAFKKIDSLMRGNTLAEVAACLGAGLFASAVVAPAFPAQQRITRGGRQLWRRSADAPWQRLTVNPVAELRRRGIEVRHAARADALQGCGAFVCDATDDAGLDALVASARRLANPILWIGTAGLAQALAGRGERRAARVELDKPFLMVVGSDHQISRSQVRWLDQARPGFVVRQRGFAMPDLAAAAARLAGRMLTRRAAALAFDFPAETTPACAAGAMEDAFALLVERVAPPRSLVVTGGDTLFRLMHALAAQALVVEDELLPGIARSRIEGGRWAGTTVVSKSGAFGGPDLLLDLAPH